jgi:hypothetical protein
MPAGLDLIGLKEAGDWETCRRWNGVHAWSRTSLLRRPAAFSLCKIMCKQGLHLKKTSRFKHSSVEQLTLHTGGGTGSIPVAPTIILRRNKDLDWRRFVFPAQSGMGRKIYTNL